MRRELLIPVFALATALLIPQALTAAIEIVIDNPAAVVVGTWDTATSAGTKYGTDYRYCYQDPADGETATYTPDIPIDSSDWEVYTWYPSGGDRAPTVQYLIHSATGDDYKYVNQQTNGGIWVYLGTYTMNIGTGNFVRIANQGSQTTKLVVADAVRFYSASGGDTTPPVISSVSASPGFTLALITWTTDEPATSQVEYGETAAYGNETTKDTNLVTSHSVSLTGLSPSTLYHYRVKSEDEVGNAAESADHIFATTSGLSTEHRAIWADTWHNGFLSPTETTEFINAVAGANYNVIIPEIRKAGDAYYDSAYEPWASNISEPEYDPLADLITKAHAQGIEVHGWLVTYRIWRTNWPAPPPTHIWSLRPDWAMKTSSGGIADGSSYNLDPGVPGVQQYICDVVKDIVSKYAIDGINFDYIRYPGTAWGYNEYTKQRFYDEYGYWPPTSSGDPNWGTWCDYRRQQVTDLLKKCYVEAMYINQNIKMSVDGVGWMGGDPNVDFTSTRAYYDVFQNLEAWMQDHIIDIHVLMNYKREFQPDQQADYRLWTDYIANYKFGRHSVDGNAAYLNSITDSITQMQYGRSAGCDGLCNYSYAVTNRDGQPASDFFDAVLTNLYPSPVPTPEMPWKSTTGVIFGQVTDASHPNDPIYQDWIYKAEVTITGPVTDTTLTDATGTYAFLDLPPGTYTISCSDQSYCCQVLSAGEVLRADFSLGATTTVCTPLGTIRAGWNLISLPFTPVNPDPAVVFTGIDIDGKLYRWNKPGQGLVPYDAWLPSLFGSVTVDDGYWLLTSSDASVCYEAHPTTFASYEIPLPKAGWSIIGCPFVDDRQWANSQVTLGAETVSLETARNNGWLSSIGYWYDSSTQSLKLLGLPDEWPDSEALEFWHGYWIRSYVDDLMLTLN